ncbi:uncharacterized protein LOC112054523 [Bicyclus anynana]|uniref:Uncharacterized protein LOC112054523 n=1 Tax=Bicyclus anynana TaxID=110368 RepID=A0A6J1NQX9_BICAN|nr:uncharacterized protein LOC112054523 [Bicyclus anynana]XP_023950110.1 uncharacterized protein LOC112054523 [Bicyclus anynana]
MEIRQSSILRISDDNTMKLIDLYEKEECLWNVSSESYKSRLERHLAAKRIAEKLKIKHFTSRYVVIKFRNLRNSYCQELKKMANSVSAGENPPYRPKVFWFKKMNSFLRPHLHPQLQTGDLPPDVSVKKEPIEKDLPVKLSNPEDVFVEESNYYSESEGSEEDALLTKRSRHSSTASKRPENPIEESQEDPNDLTRMMKDISSHLHVMTNQRMDSFDSFGTYVAAMLRSMPVQRALEVQPRIVEMLVSATMGKCEPKEVTARHLDPLSYTNFNA